MTPTRSALAEKVARVLFEELDALGIPIDPQEEARLGKAALRAVWEAMRDA